MKTEHIEIRKGLGRSITVGVLQLKSPFFDDIEEVLSKKGDDIFAISKTTQQNYRKRIEKIKKILERLESQKHIDILVFPEYTFLKDDGRIIGANENTIQICQKFSNMMKTIVVGNYYDEDTRASVSFVVLPEGYALNDQYTAIKQTVSTYDDNVLKSVDKIKEEDKKVLKFWWKPDDEETKAYFQILTCKDYLYFTSVEPLREWPEIISVDAPGVIISPMSTPEIKTFESRAMGLIRDIRTETGGKSIISILCNATSIPTQEKNNICGQSQIISPIDIKKEIRPLLKRGIEGIIIATINPFKSIIRPTPTNEQVPNAVLLSSRTYEIIESGNNAIDLIEIGTSRKHTGVVVNPKVLNGLGLKKIYGFVRGDDYQEIKTKVKERFKLFKDISIPIHGIYGIHDILTYSYEEFFHDESGKEILKTRLWPIIKDSVCFDENHFGYCIVDDVIKYHGENLSGKKPKGIVHRDGNEEEIRLQLRRIALGEYVGAELITKLKKNNIVIETYLDTSDISDKEKNEGMLEFLVIITLVRPDKGPIATDMHDEFKNFISSYLMNDERVRTIEKIRSEGKGFVEGHYILHVVGDLADLNNVVIGKIHTVFTSCSCGTRVIIPAESLSFNRYPSLMEIGTRKSIEPQIMDILNQWKRLEINDERMMKEMVPSAINLLDETTRSVILSVYYHADKLSDQYIQDNDRWMDDMYSLIYGVTCAIVQKKIGLDINDGKLYNFCNAFSTDIGRAIEKELIMMFEDIAERRGIPLTDIEMTLNWAIKVLKETEGKVNIGKMEIGTAAFALESMRGLCAKDKYKKKIESEFRNLFNDEHKVKQQMEYLNIICAELFKKHLFILDINAKQHLKSGEVDEELREMFRLKNTTLSNSVNINKIDEKTWKMVDMANQYIIIEETDRVDIYFEVITKYIVNGIKNFSADTRNLMSHTDYGKSISPKQMLNATHSALKFLEKINSGMKRG